MLRARILRLERLLRVGILRLERSEVDVQNACRTLALLFSLALAGPVFADANPWFVTEPGTRWSYRATLNLSWKLLDGGQIPSEAYVGRSLTEVANVVAEPGTGGKIVTIRSKRFLDESGKPDREETQRWAVRNGDIFAEGSSTKLDALRLPRNPQVGTELAPRRHEMQGGVVVLHGRVEGVQDAVTPAGTFEKCLRVRWEGQVRSGARQGGYRIERGKIVETVWYAQGIGRVLSVMDEELIVDGREGRENVKARSGYELTGFSPGPSAPAKPR